MIITLLVCLAATVTTAHQFFYMVSRNRSSRHQDSEIALAVCFPAVSVSRARSWSRAHRRAYHRPRSAVLRVRIRLLQRSRGAALPGAPCLRHLIEPHPSQLPISVPGL